MKKKNLKSSKKSQKHSGKKIKENTAFTINDTTINTIVNASTSIAVQFQFDAPTFEQCWNEVYANKIAKKSISCQRNYRCAFNKFSNLHGRKINTITLIDLQPIFDEQMSKGVGRSLLCNMKCVLNYIYDYALKYDYAFKRYPDYIEWEGNKNRVVVFEPFTKEEIQKLYETKDSKLCEIILIYIYTGMRPMELINMIAGDVHLDEDYMVGGVKTYAGKNRIIPIHPCIKPFIRNLLKSNTRYMLYNDCCKHAVDRYRESIFYPAMDVLGMDHYPYDTRHTFATLCNEYKLDDFAIKRLMGHACGNITQDVYTHAYIEYLQNQIRLIPAPDKLNLKETKLSKIMRIIKGGVIYE